MLSVLAMAIDLFANLLYFLIFIRVIISWFPIPRNNPIIQILYALTEPILGPIRYIIAKSPLGGPGMMLDFSPIIAYVLIMLVKALLLSLLRGLVL